jgi:hypothetical protein
MGIEGVGYPFNRGIRTRTLADQRED